MTDATSTSLPTSAYGRFEPPTGLFARIGAFFALVATAIEDAQEMRREAKRRYPYLSDDV